ncbi:MAG TPA: DUF72 domain-containing protein [Dokdonella sp.]
MATRANAAPRGPIRVGISGWRYAPWRGVFYPGGLAQTRELEFAASRFDSIEINGSFYSLQHPRTYARWHAQTPANFVFALKGPRYITHMRRLRDVETPLANFFASGVLRLERKLGPLLWQFPPNFAFDAERWEQFLALLPKHAHAAGELARRCDARLRDADPPRERPRRRLRHAVEVRHESFRDEAFVALLRRHRVGLVVADTAGRWPLLEDVTADFVYVRLHGDQELYASGYGDAALDGWARRVAAWASGTEPADARRASKQRAPRLRRRAVYCYFDNDAKVHAPFDAARLRARLGLAGKRGMDDARE